MADVSLDGKKGENVILKQPSYRFESCPDYEGWKTRLAALIDKRKSFLEASPN